MAVQLARRGWMLAAGLLIGSTSAPLAAQAPAGKEQVTRRRPPVTADAAAGLQHIGAASEAAGSVAAAAAAAAAAEAAAAEARARAAVAGSEPPESTAGSGGASIGALSTIAVRTHGRVICRSPDPAGARDFPLEGLQVSVADQSVTTDAAGDFTLFGLAAGDAVRLTVWYDGAIVAPGGAPSTPLQVMDDIHEPRSESVDRVALVVGTNGLDLAFDPIVLDSADCELWRIGADALRDYHAVRGASPPAGRLRIKRWGGVVVGGGHTFYDYLCVETDFLTEQPGRWGREDTIFHEFGHSVRHVADGSQSHWDLDNFRWAYGRKHAGSEISNVHYAFNEGFAEYWALARRAPGRRFPSTLGADHRFWVENLVTNALLDLAQTPGVGDRAMLETLEQSAGEIHSLWAFEDRFALLHGLPRPAPPPECPPNFRDDGLLCANRDLHIEGKPSETRGAGTIPSECQPGEERNGALCYPNCNPGYSGAGPVCWKQCPAGYTDDGAFCRRDVQIVGADNSACPVYDKCGLTLAKGCSTCPTGFHNDGCTCRIDVDIQPKDTYTRGAGSPMICPAGLDSDAGLCYAKCPPGLSGAGPVCWGSCPDGTWDNGATCYKGVIVK